MIVRHAIFYPPSTRVHESPFKQQGRWRRSPLVVRNLPWTPLFSCLGRVLRHHQYRRLAARSLQ